MDRPTKKSTRRHSRIESISTRWPLLGDTTQFCLRYGKAIHKYVLSMVRDEHDADEVSQNLLVRVLERGFAHVDPGRGRFRDYLKAIVRNAVRSFQQRKQPRGRVEVDLSQIVAASDTASSADRQWVEDWRQCLLDAAWRALERQERASPGNLGYTVLRLTLEHPEEDSATLASRVPTRDGAAMRPDAFRKQLSRARRAFAEHLAREVARTLEAPTRARVEEELSDVGLMSYVRDLLPPGWTPEAAEEPQP